MMKLQVVGSAAESRGKPRLRLAPMYTLVRVRRAGQARYRWTGYIYDISASGMRFDLDEALVEGTRVEVRATLPGSPGTTVHATGEVVRLHEDKEARELGPVRMGMVFTSFTTDVDRRRLTAYLAQGGMRRAA